MSSYLEQEKRFLKKVIASNIHPTLLNPDNIVFSKPIDKSKAFQTAVFVKPNLNSFVFFTERRIEFTRFNLRDCLPKKTDTQLSVPLSAASSIEHLLNYMNEIYLHSTNVRVIVPEFDVFRGFQFLLKKESLKSFVLSSPIVGSTLILEANQDSWLFEGSLKIKFN